MSINIEKQHIPLFETIPLAVREQILEAIDNNGMIINHGPNQGIEAFLRMNEVQSMLFLPTPPLDPLLVFRRNFHEKNTQGTYTVNLTDEGQSHKK